MSSEPESFESLGDFYPTPKMDDLKPISHKEFNEFIKGKGFKKEGLPIERPLLVERRVLVISLEGMEPTKFGSMRKATKAIAVEEESLSMQGTMGKISFRDLRMKTSRCFS